MPGNIPQPEGFSSSPVNASATQNKTRRQSLQTSHRVSGLVQRNVPRKTCEILWALRFTWVMTVIISH
jgi:hypothetical protein